MSYKCDQSLRGNTGLGDNDNLITSLGDNETGLGVKEKLDMGLGVNGNFNMGLGGLGVKKKYLDTGLGKNETGLCDNGQYSNGPKVVSPFNGKMSFSRPIIPGRCIKRAQSDFGPSSSRATLKDDSGKSNHGPNRLDQVTARCDSFLANNPSSCSPSPLVRRTNSEPGRGYSIMGKLVGRLNSLRPKTRDYFSKGRIFRWDDSVKDKREANQLKNINCSAALTAREVFNDTRINSVTKDLKVYFWKRVPLCPKYGLIPEKDSDLMEDLIDEMESDAEGDKVDKRLLSSIDSISSSSNSEESFHSEKAKEEDADTKLEGISTLMVDSFSIDDNKQQAMLQEDNSNARFPYP